MGRSSVWPVIMGGALIMCTTSPLYAQSDRTNVPGMGMARTSVISSSSLDAVGINPANLASSTGKTVTISFLPLGVHVGSNFLNYDLYTSYFTGIDTDSGRVGRYLTQADKDRILNAFPDGVGTAFTNVEFRLFGIAVEVPIGTFAFNITEQANAYARIPRDYASFVLLGNPPGSFRDFSQTDAKASWTRTYAISYGMSLPTLTFIRTLDVGATVKLIQGFGYFGVERFGTSVATASNGVLTGVIHYSANAAGVDFLQDQKSGSNFNPFPAPAGIGYGIDLGVSTHITDFLYAGLSLTDFGTMQWTRNAIQNSVDTTIVVDDPIGTGQWDAVEKTLRGNKHPVASFYSTLPTQLHAGAAIQIDRLPGNEFFPGQLLVELDYTQGFQNTPASTTTPRFSLGVEYHPLGWLPIRTGVSVGGTDVFNVAFGFGLHFGGFDFDLATENATLLFAPRSFSYASLALGMKVRI